MNRRNQHNLTSQVRALMGHIDRHPHLLDTDIYSIRERQSGHGYHQGLELRLWGEVHDHNGAHHLAVWAASFEGWESHAFRNAGTGDLVGHITGHIGSNLVEVTCDLPADTPTVPGGHGYERWTPDLRLAITPPAEPPATEWVMDVADTDPPAGGWATYRKPGQAPTSAHLTVEQANAWLTRGTDRAALLAEVAGISLTEASEVAALAELQPRDHLTHRPKETPS